MAIETLAWNGLWLPVGAGLAFLFFHLLALNSRFYAGGRAVLAMGLHAGRLAGTALLFVLAARQGAVPLLALLAGFLAVRPLLMRRHERA